jgi:toxin ParE1/3/4
MALRLVVAPLAERDLTDIAEFKSRDSVQAAHKVLVRIERVVDLLLQRPFLGPAVTKPKREGLRKMTVVPYIIFYRIAGDELQLVRVLHSSRDLDDEELFSA